MRVGRFDVLLFSALVIGTASVALAQPGTAPAPAAPAPVQAQTWYRITLTDGRVLDAQLVGGDAASYFVQVPTGTFSIARAQVSSMTAIQPNTYAPPPLPASAALPPPAPPPPNVEVTEESRNRTRIAGIGGFIASYGLTVLIARARVEAPDEDARWGYLPVVGPLIWSASDAGKWGEDGWDWLAALDALIQGGSLYAAIAAPADSPPTKKRGSIFGLAPVHTNDFRGVSYGGSF